MEIQDLNLTKTYTLTGHTGRVWNVHWHPNGQSLASCGEDRNIHIWTKEGDKYVNKTILTQGHQRTIRQVAFSPCGNYLASASFDATTAIWDKKEGQFDCSLTLEGHDNEVKSVAWSTSGNLLATCSRDKSVWIWEVAYGDEFECASVLNAHTQDVKKVVWHPVEEMVASASYDNTIKMFKEDPLDNDWYCVSTLASHTSTVWSLSFNRDGTRLASVSDDKTLKIWEQSGENWVNVSTISGVHSRSIYDVSWCALTGLLATASGDDAIRIFKEDEGSSPPNFSLIYTKERAHSQDVNSVMWNPKIAGVLASCSDDGEVKVWEFSVK